MHPTQVGSKIVTTNPHINPMSMYVLVRLLLLLLPFGYAFDFRSELSPYRRRRRRRRLHSPPPSFFPSGRDDGHLSSAIPFRRPEEEGVSAIMDRSTTMTAEIRPSQGHKAFDHMGYFFPRRFPTMALLKKILQFQ